MGLKAEPMTRVLIVVPKDKVPAATSALYDMQLLHVHDHVEGRDGLALGHPLKGASVASEMLIRLRAMIATLEISEVTVDMRRPITSLMEELEAVDWYNQRVDACKDADLRAILAHNRDEEKEHASMVLEWIRRKDPTFDKELKDYLFTEKPIAHG